MHLGISSYTFVWAAGVPGYPAPVPALTPAALLDRAVEFGVRVVQIGDNLPLHHLPEKELDALAGRATSLGIDLELGTRGIGGEQLSSYLRLAERLQSPILRVLLDANGDRPSADEAVARLAAILPDFERTGVTLAIENHDRFRVATLAEILERLDSPFAGICLDTANSIGCLESLETVVRTLGRWAVNLHVKDFAIVRACHHKGFVVEGRPAGQGMLDLPWLLAELRRLGRDPNAILELWPPLEPTISESIAKEAAWATESIRYLRQFIPD